MAFDTICVRKIILELSENIIGGKVDKIYQPEKDELLLNIRTKCGNFRLVLSASSNNARVHFTDTSKENPLTAPMFCMLLRKHLTGGKIVNIKQPEFERIIEIDIESYNELGDLTLKHLITEITGRNSNIVLCDETYKIIDSAKHIDFLQSSYRQILPGALYILPPKQEKTPILSDDIKNIELDFEKQGEKPENVIMTNVSGISPLTARELVFNVTSSTSLLCGELTDNQKYELTHQIKSFNTNIPYKPCIIFDTNGKPIEFSAIDIKQYGSNYKVEYFDTLSDVVHTFYQERDKQERMRQKSADLIKLIKTNIERLTKKLTIQQKTLNNAEKKEKYKIYGDLVTANIYKINKGDNFVEVDNYYEGTKDKIELDPILSPSQNAQRYYKMYNKLKNAEVEVKKQLEATKSDLQYFESTLVLTENSTTEHDINAIKFELSELGYSKQQKTKNKKKIPQSKPMHFISSDGFDIYVGKNNTQNDILTLRFANSSDIWFHTKQIHGSHTIIKLGLDKDVPDSTLLEAAKLAAYYSKARESSQVPVDYTQIKNVKKPNGAKPGMVIYDNYNTLYVTPQNLEQK